MGGFENLGGANFIGSNCRRHRQQLRCRDGCATDLDGDGDADVLWAGSNMVAWHENLGGGVIGQLLQITGAVDTPKSVTASDIDGDGDLDVLSASAGDSKIAYYVNNGANLQLAVRLGILGTILRHLLRSGRRW
ncbi:MAG: VCBS repeat-containing protein [Planctomycetota bacterium]